MTAVPPTRFTSSRVCIYRREYPTRLYASYLKPVLHDPKVGQIWRQEQGLPADAVLVWTETPGASMGLLEAHVAKDSALGKLFEHSAELFLDGIRYVYDREFKTYTPPAPMPMKGYP